MRGWDLFRRLQAIDAYGETAISTKEEADLSKLFACAVAGRKFERSLVIGPGGPSEVAAIRNAAGGEVHGLTSHKPEYDVIKHKCKATLGDMHEMPYQSGVFDLVYASNVLEHAYAPYIALIHIRRVLKDGGVFLCIVPSFDMEEGGNGPFHLHCLDEKVWLELLRKTGLSPAWRQTSDGYYIFSCVASEPPHPHGDMLQRLRECWTDGQ